MIQLSRRTRKPTANQIGVAASRAPCELGDRSAIDEGDRREIVGRCELGDRPGGDEACGVT